jgi:alanyl-tRNA synthetase
VKAVDIRTLFRDFFVARGHQAGEAASLVPAGDPSVLFTTAGMQQYKPYYLGVETPPATRMTTCQRCFRTSDIENVGHTARHLTFFEMLGNFSFGDYFKQEAIAWSLELMDELDVPRERLWISIFGGDDQLPADDEADTLWRDQGIPAERIVRLGRKDNFWGPAGPTGPCGPCSELYYDMGPEAGCGRPDCAPGCDCDRFMEFYNLVFVQYDMDERSGLMQLPKPSIDTGMGLERIAAITQSVPSVYESDAFQPLMALAEQLAGVGRDSSAVATRALRTMAEHARGAAFLVMDGVLPGNEGRDYVLRRVIRRAVQQGVGIGVEEPFLARLCGAVVDLMQEAYPQLATSAETIALVVGDEEVRFRRTLEQGLGILTEALRRARGAGTELPAEVAFTLHDTYGFPFDLTREIAADDGMTVDEERFEALMGEQRERARTAQKAGAFGAGPGEVEAFQRDTAQLPVEFVGYERLEVFTVVRARRELSDGRLALKLGESPFYAEGGGQAADGGWIHTDSGKLEVDEVVRFENDQVVVAHVQEGAVAEGERAKAMVNAVRRHQTACNHTATHLLHNALRVVLGDGVRQGGSSVRADRLRFDFSVRQAPTGDQLRKVEELVNRRIVENHPVRPFVTTREYAAEIGALAFFEEKYGEFVRVLEIDDFSRELCGGTHVSSTSQIGLFKITGSQSVGANTRRIEAITSAEAIRHYRELETAVEAGDQAGAELLKVKPAAQMTAEAHAALSERLVKELARTHQEVARLEQRLAAGGGDDRRTRLVELADGAEDLTVGKLVAARIDGASPEELLTLCDALRERLGEVVTLLAADTDGRVAVVVAATDAFVGRKVQANDVLKAVMPAIEGKGGGKPTLARGGGPKTAGVDDALAAGIAAVRRVLDG